MWPYHDPSGRLVGYAARVEYSTTDGRRQKDVFPLTFNHVANEQGNYRYGWRGQGVPAPRPLYRSHQLAAAPSAPVIVTEGEKVADAVTGLFPGYLATTSMGGAKAPRKSDWALLAGRDVVIWPDQDEPGRRYAEQVAELATMAGAASVSIVIVPANWPEGWDIADPLPDGADIGMLPELLRSARPWASTLSSRGVAPPVPSQLPVINVVTGLRHIAANQGLAALVAAEIPFYQRNRKIVRVALVKAKNSAGEVMFVPGIVDVDKPTMERQLAHSATWTKFDGRSNRDVQIDPPGPVATQILSMLGEWPFEPLRGIIQCPTLRPDGTLLDRQGYDPATSMVLTNTLAMPPVPDPTQQNAEAGLGALLALLEEFPFVDEASKAVALSMLITPVVRGAIDVAPMHLITKPVAGTGGSYLVDCAAMIATGEKCAVEAMAPNYEETEKRLIGAALSGFPIIGIDNVREIIAGEFFCQVVERPLMSLRALGSSDKHRIPNTFTVFANDNNATVADMVRRTIRALLDANREHPEERSFKRDPLTEIQNNRGDYVTACLTIPLAYIKAGSPLKKQITPLASFGEWCRYVREPLIWLGCADPVGTQHPEGFANRRSAKGRNHRCLRCNRRPLWARKRTRSIYKRPDRGSRQRHKRRAVRSPA
jgi:putative DNA primase/helicase